MPAKHAWRPVSCARTHVSSCGAGLIAQKSGNGRGWPEKRDFAKTRFSPNIHQRLIKGGGWPKKTLSIKALDAFSCPGESAKSGTF